MTMNLLTGCMSPLLSNMLFLSDSAAYAPRGPSIGLSVETLMSADIVMMTLVPVCLITMILGMACLRGLLANAQQESPEDRLAKWRKEAEAGNDDAEFHLGVCYASGEGVPMNAEEAAHWYRQAAEQGHAIAQYNLGLCYYHGGGVEQDLDEAVKWFHEAASRELPDACHSLGVCHANGVGVPKDKEEAARWYHAAAELGHAKSQFHLGLCYSGGHGVPKDNLTAYAWWNISAAAGSTEAARKRDALARRMTREDVADAQRKCRNWMSQGSETADEHTEPVFAENGILTAQAA